MVSKQEAFVLYMQVEVQGWNNEYYIVTYVCKLTTGSDLAVGTIKFISQ